MEIRADSDLQMTILIFILSVAGICAIYVAVGNIEPEQVSVTDVKGAMDGKVVSITGTLCKIRKTKTGSVFWSLGDEVENVTVPLLETGLKGIPAAEGDIVNVIGMVSEYNGEKEIIPKRIAIEKEAA
jgi:RecJ-like exonuclease